MLIKQSSCVLLLKGEVVIHDVLKIQLLLRFIKVIIFSLNLQVENPTQTSLFELFTL